MCGLRLVVRTPGFHPGNRGSIPLGRTKIKTEYKILMVIIYGRIAQLGEHLPYKQGGHWFEPNCDHHYGGVAQLVRVLACHARCREFESRHFRHLPR